MKIIRSVADVVDALGGTMSVSALLGVLPSSVSNAKSADRFPAHWHIKIDRLCAERGITLPADFWFRGERKASRRKAS
jgi:hypothetical protein